MQHNISSALDKKHSFRFRNTAVTGDKIAKHAIKAKEKYEAIVAITEEPVNTAKDAVKNAPSDIIIGGTVASASGYVTTKVDKWGSKASKAIRRAWKAKRKASPALLKLAKKAI